MFTARNFSCILLAICLITKSYAKDILSTTVPTSVPIISSTSVPNADITNTAQIGKFDVETSTKAITNAMTLDRNITPL